MRRSAYDVARERQIRHAAEAPLRGAIGELLVGSTLAAVLAIAGVLADWPELVAIAAIVYLFSITLAVCIRWMPPRDED